MARGWWRRSIPKSWRAPTTRVESTYDYDEELDVHTFHPLHDNVIDKVAS